MFELCPYIQRSSKKVSLEKETMKWRQASRYSQATVHTLSRTLVRSDMVDWDGHVENTAGRTGPELALLARVNFQQIPRIGSPQVGL